MNKKLILSFVLLFCLLAFPLKSAGLAAGSAAPQAQDGPVATPTPDPLAVEGGQAPAEPLEPNDQVINDDLDVTGSICVGSDCVNGEAFSNTQLKFDNETNHIWFNDTTSVAGEPDNDWAIDINDDDSAPGTAEFFAIRDATASLVPFRIMAGAPDSAIYVAANGKIGLGTSSPTSRLTIQDSDSPGIAFHQFGGGSTEQTWSLQGNDWGFWLLDYWGPTVPFGIDMGAPDYSLYVYANGNVGIGTNTPQSRLHVVGGMQGDGFKVEASTPANTLYVDSAGEVGIGTDAPLSKLHVAGNAYVSGRMGIGTPSPADQLHVDGGMRADGFAVEAGTPYGTLYVDSPGKVGIGVLSPAAKLHIAGDLRADGFTVEASTPTNTLYVDSAGRVGIGTANPTSRLHVAGDIGASGNLTLDGFVNERSDAASKTAFAAVNNQDVLERLASVPISTWSYKDSPEVRHMGPTAQDFRSAYGLGPDEKHLAALDTNGVALAAIQALDSQGKEKDAQIRELQARLKAVEARQGITPWSQLTPLVFGLLGVLVGTLITSRKR